MDHDLVADFFALLLLGALAGLAGSFTRVGRAAIGDSSVFLAAVVAGGAMAGSLYFSEVADFIPCELCWFQRIAMYPLAVVLGLAAYRNDRSIRPYGLTLAAIGLAIAVYHVQLQAFPEQSAFCELDNPCTAKAVEALGFMTIPQMSAVAFVIIVRLLWITRSHDA